MITKLGVIVTLVNLTVLILPEFTFYEVVYLMISLRKRYIPIYVIPKIGQMYLPRNLSSPILAIYRL
jgi:hypothetical protein